MFRIFTKQFFIKSFFDDLSLERSKFFEILSVPKNLKILETYLILIDLFSTIPISWLSVHVAMVFRIEELGDPGWKGLTENRKNIKRFDFHSFSTKRFFSFFEFSKKFL